VTLRPFRFSTLSGVHHAISTRYGGTSDGPYATLNLGYGTADVEERVAANRRVFVESLGICAANVISARLTHGVEVSIFRQGQEDDLPVTRWPVRRATGRTEPFFPTDGVVSDLRGQHFLLTFADCVPLLFFDPVRKVMGAAHAGWRGTAAGMAVEIVRAMRDQFGCEPEDIQAGIGPSIGPCCYEVGPEVDRTFDAAGHSPVMEGRNLDLWSTNEQQLRDVGVGRVERADLCTACRSDTFFSHRRGGGITGRFGLCAGLA
jgi:YfiH family protein